MLRFVDVRFVNEQIMHILGEIKGTTALKINFNVYAKWFVCIVPAVLACVYFCAWDAPDQWLAWDFLDCCTKYEKNNTQKIKKNRIKIYEKFATDECRNSP